MTWQILDCDGEVVDTADSGAVAMKKKEKISELSPKGRPYSIEGEEVRSGGGR